MKFLQKLHFENCQISMAQSESASVVTNGIPLFCAVLRKVSVRGLRLAFELFEKISDTLFFLLLTIIVSVLIK